jgi:hypothetical protein
VPVGCLFVIEETNQILAKSHNLTNATGNVNKNNEMLSLYRQPHIVK